MKQLASSLSDKNIPGRKAGVPFLFLMCILLSFLLSGCGSPPQMSNTSSSIDEISRKVLAAVEKKDSKELESMRVTEKEFKELIFPGLPIGKIEQWQKAFDFVWGDINTKSTHGLSYMLASYGGKKFSYIKTIFKKGVTTYELESRLLFWKPSYKGYEDARIAVKDETGTEDEIKLYGGIIEYKGRYKIMTFNVFNK